MDVRHGPSDLVVIGFDGGSVPEAVRTQLDAALEAGIVRLLDLIVLSRDESGQVHTVEADDLGLEFDGAGLTLYGQGFVGAEDIGELAEDLGPGQTALVLLLEHVWARELTAAVNDSGGELVSTIRIPAWVLDEVEHLAGPAA